jgi:hypothetical protein
VSGALFIQKMNKKTFITKYIKDTSSICWPKEMKIVKTLFSIFPDSAFWESLSINFKLNSLCWFLSDDGRKFLNSEYKKFTFKPVESKVFNVRIGLDSNLNFDYSSYSPNKKTLKNFLKLW